MQLVSIRRCGFMERIFYMEMGRSAVTGGGEFWMEAEDNNIAHNMHAAILNAMTNSNTSRDEVGPRQRMRSSSANEASKPISVLPRRHTGQKLLGFSPLGKLQTSHFNIYQLKLFLIKFFPSLPCVHFLFLNSVTSLRMLL